MLEASNATLCDFGPNVCVQEIIEAQAERNPGAIAIVFEDKQVTYAELNAKANRVAHRLRSSGAGPGKIITISVDRSLDMVIALLAILKSGSAYLPLDPAHPQDRLALILKEVRPHAIITQGLLVEMTAFDAVRSVESGQRGKAR